ncbi:MAG: hypothetical protein D6747_02265, partial [Chlorobiota bacterium]
MRFALYAALSCVLLAGCSSNDRTRGGQPQVLHRTRLVQIESDSLLVMSPEQARQFGTTAVRTDSAKLMLRVAGRAVAKAVVPADSVAPALLVFESNDAAQRYTEYLKA